MGIYGDLSRIYGYLSRIYGDGWRVSGNLRCCAGFVLQDEEVGRKQHSTRLARGNSQSQQSPRAFGNSPQQPPNKGRSTRRTTVVSSDDDDDDDKGGNSADGGGDGDDDMDDFQTKKGSDKGKQRSPKTKAKRRSSITNEDGDGDDGGDGGDGDGKSDGDGEAQGKRITRSRVKDEKKGGDGAAKQRQSRGNSGNSGSDASVSEGDVVDDNSGGSSSGSDSGGEGLVEEDEDDVDDVTGKRKYNLRRQRGPAMPYNYSPMQVCGVSAVQCCVV